MTSMPFLSTQAYNVNSRALKKEERKESKERDARPISSEWPGHFLKISDI